jgi:hypothetical protein
VRNITDIDDKIIKRAVERNIPIRQLTDEMTVAITWTSLKKPSGNSGRIGRSIRREVRVSSSEV